MPLSRWFYWLFICSLLILFFLLGYGGIITYRSENNRIQEDIENVVQQTAKKVQNENFVLYDLGRVFTDKDYKENIAFAAGITQNKAKLSYGPDDSLPADSSLQHAEKKKDDSITVTIFPNGSKPFHMSVGRKWMDTAKKYVPDGVKTIKYFDSLLSLKLKEEKLNVSYRIEKQNKYHTDSVRSTSGLFIINLYDPVVYRLVYTVPASLLMVRLAPYAGIALLLLLMLSAAFVLYLRSYKLQMQMAQFKESLFSNVTHELKTPLSSLQLIIASFKGHEQGLSVKQKEYIDFAGKELLRMNLLIEKILSFGKLNQEQFALNKEIINLPGLINEAIRIMNINVGNKNAQIFFEQGHNIDVIGDKILLLNMLISIIDNAIKYTAGNPEIHISLEQRKGDVKIMIRDNGPGISPKFQSKIFEPFFRVPAGNEHSVKGHGLGLSFVQQVAELHSGKIFVESEQGRGSTFIITLPA